MEKEYQDLTAAEVKEYMRNNREDTYQLIDVRFPEEYEEEHLPGAILIPVGEIEKRVSELSPEKNIIFYCLSGKRSVAASVFIGTSQKYQGKVFNMLGGILAWDGHCLSDMPNLKPFGVLGNEEDLLYQAMNLEKGAHRFYQLVLEKFEKAPFSAVMEILVKAEEVHAEMIYEFWKKSQVAPPSFQSVYDSLAGDILEGGQEIEVLIEWLKQENMQCRNVIEQAISIEFSAYDLYRNMAHLKKNTSMEKPFLVLCQSEKEHMRLAAEALACCS